MKFLIDALLPPRLCAWLIDRGHEAEHVIELGLLAATDSEIAERAIADNAAILSKDDDFLTLRLPDRFAFVWVRCGNATNRHLLDWMGKRWDQVEHLLASGERMIELR